MIIIERDSDSEGEDDVYQTTYLDKLPIRAEDIQQATKHDMCYHKFYNIL